MGKAIYLRSREQATQCHNNLTRRLINCSHESVQKDNVFLFRVMSVSFQKFDGVALLLCPLCANFPCTPVYSLAQQRVKGLFCMHQRFEVYFTRVWWPACCSLCFAELLVFVFGSAISMANPRIQHYPTHWWTHPGWKPWYVCLCINPFSCFYTLYGDTLQFTELSLFPQTHFLPFKAPLIRIFCIKWLWITLKVSLVPTKNYHQNLQLPVAPQSFLTTFS